jgi:hypothetical protein
MLVASVHRHQGRACTHQVLTGRLVTVVYVGC